jgi:putative salt-induced outer membrane protein
MEIPPMSRRLLASAALFGALIPGIALAEPIPEPVVRIITQAAASGNAATLQTAVDLAKSTNPNSVAEIDALVASLKAKADQAHIEKLNNQGFFEGWSGEGEIGASSTSGTSDVTTIALGASLLKDGLKWRHKLNAVANYQHSDGETTAERYLASYEANYKITERLFALGLLQWEQDRFAGFDSRYTEAVGAGYSLFTGPEVKWDVSAGPSFRQTSLITGHDESDVSARLATLLLWNITADTVFSEDAGMYLGGSDNTYYSTTALTTKIMGNLSARVSFNVTVEGNPPPGIEDTNTITRLTLVYGF